MGHGGDSVRQKLKLVKTEMEASLRTWLATLTDAAQAAQPFAHNLGAGNMAADNARLNDFIDDVAKEMVVELF
jgi:hypothetical protein